MHKNPQEDIYQEVSQAVAANEGHCCCAVKKEDSTKCICSSFKAQDTSGFCHCRRFFKINEYPTIALIYAPQDREIALGLAESFSEQGFCVNMPAYSSLESYLQNFKLYDDLIAQYIYKSEVVFILNPSQESVDFLRQAIEWAVELNKKITYSHAEGINYEN
jgi:hypothetical protein